MSSQSQVPACAQAEVGEDQIQVAHRELMAYTETTPAMLQQVDAEQYCSLNAKYHHYLMQYEKDEQTLRRKMEMFQRLDTIILKSHEVQEELRSIEEITRTLQQVAAKSNIVGDSLAKCRAETEELARDTENMKGGLLKAKDLYFQQRSRAERDQSPASHEMSSMTTSPKRLARKLLLRSTLKQSSVQGANCSPTSRPDPKLVAAQAISYLKVCLRKLTAHLLRPSEPSVDLAIDNIRIRKKIKERHKLDLARSGLLGWGGKEIIQRAYDSASKSPFLRPIDKTNSKTIKSKLEDWPSEILLREGAIGETLTQRKMDTDDIRQLEKMSGRQLFRLLCEDTDKLQCFEDSLHRRLRKTHKL